jgi:hypothetical protein
MYKMEYALNVIPEPKAVYQDTRDSSSNWRTPTRIFHPLTEHQFMNRFRLGDIVKLKVSYPNIKGYINPMIVNIVPYDMAQRWLGSYNIGDSFKGFPFTHVLILQP